MTSFFLISTFKFLSMMATFLIFNTNLSYYGLIVKDNVQQTESIGVLNEYIEAVNLQDYRRAYNTFLYPRSRYATFANGWEYTASIEGYFGEFQPYRRSQQRGNIPGLLVLTLTNGATETYNGCYFTIAVDDNWYIEDFSFQLLFRRSPTSSDIEDFTSHDCSDLRIQKNLTVLPLPENVEAIEELRELELPVFRIGYRAVIAAYQVSIRDRATSAGNEIQELNRNDTVTISGGPLKSIRFVWWEVRLDNGLTGWVPALSEDGTQLLDLP